MSLVRLKIYTLCHDIDKYTIDYVMVKLSKWLKVDKDAHDIIYNMIKQRYSDNCIICIMTKLNMDVSLLMTPTINIWLECVNQSKHKLIQYIVNQQNEINIC